MRALGRALLALTCAAGAAGGATPDDPVSVIAGRATGPRVVAERRSRSVFGAHRRMRVTAGEAVPYRMVGQIAVGCTGTLVGPRHVLTAGHCVYDIDENRWLSQLEFAPGRQGESVPHGWIPWEKAYAVRGWTEAHDTSYDYALIVLKEPVGNSTGWMAYGSAEGLSGDTLVSIAGYPGDEPAGTLWRSSCPLLAVTSTQLHYDCDTYNGESGSAIFRVNALTGARVIYGVHTNGGDAHNRGTRLTSAAFRNLKAWKAADP